jgi:hypothetical protein
VLGRRARAAEVVQQHGVGVDPARRAVEEDDRRAGADLGQQVAMVASRGDDQQRVDRSAQQPEDQLTLPLGVLLARAGDEDVAASVRGVLDRARDRGVERVGDVLDDQPERVGPPWRSERATSLRANPSRAIAASTRAAVSARTPASRFTTRETVFRLTPAVLATSRIVGLATSSPPPQTLDRALTTLSWAVGGTLTWG